MSRRFRVLYGLACVVAPWLGAGLMFGAAALIPATPVAVGGRQPQATGPVPLPLLPGECPGAAGPGLGARGAQVQAVHQRAIRAGGGPVSHRTIGQSHREQVRVAGP